MSLMDDWFAETGALQLLETNGENVTHYPLGVIANAAPVTGAFSEEEVSVDKSRGKEIVHLGELLVASSLSLSHLDKWLVNSTEWQTTSVSEAEGGLVTVNLKRIERIKQN